MLIYFIFLDRYSDISM